MIIKSIKICNFLSYFDEVEFKFDEGATLIIGQNNTGKSKLFDAYNWVLYDDAYKTAAEDWESTSFWKDELVNRNAKQLCQINSKVSAFVSLTFEDEESNRFVVLREYRIQKTAENTWNCPSASEISVTKITASNYNNRIFVGVEATELINQIFPKNLSRYFLFQGESISRLLRLNQRSDFTKAIGELSGLKYFKKAKRYAESIYKRAKSEFENKAEQDENVQREKIALTKDIDEFSERVAELNEKLENEYKEKNIKQIKFDEKIEELSRYEECAKLLGEIKILENQRDEKIEQRTKLFEQNRSNLFSTWMYYGVSDLFSNFLRLYRKGKEEKKIPEPIRQDFIQEMLQEQVCKICWTPAPEGSDQFKHINSFVNEKSLDKEIALINALSDGADSMKFSIDEVPKNVNIFTEELGSLQKEINDIIEKIGYKEDEFRIVTERIEDEKKTRIHRSDIEKVNLTQLRKDRDILRSELSNSSDQIAGLNGRIDEANKSLSKVKAAYEDLMRRSTNEFEKKRLELASSILNQISLLHDNFLSKLLNDIEHESNSYFQSMTRSNPALSGRVRVDYLASEVYTVDEAGDRMSNINQANKVSLQISFIAAVLSVSNKIWEKHFPFVADAPISALGGNNKINAVKTIIEIFRQSIVILKDDADIENNESIENDQVRQLIRLNSKIKNAYELRMEGQTTINQRTKKIVLK